MTVYELIKELQELPGDTRVFVTGYEGGYSDVDGTFSIRDFILNVNTSWYYGPHEEYDSFSARNNPGKPVVKGVVIS